jgi:hypothetical protein
MPVTDTGLPVAGFQPFDEALQSFFTMRVYPDVAVQDQYETLVPVMGPPVLNLGTQIALNPISNDTTNINTRMNQIVKLPATALTQLSWDFDLRRWTRASFRKLGWTEEGKKVIQSNQLVPMDVMYQLDLWAKYRSTANQMVRNILLLFTNREPWLDVDLKGVWGVRRIPLTLLYKGPANLTDYEPKDKDRTIRMVFTFIFHAWVIPDASMVPSIGSIMENLYYPTSNVVPYPDISALPPYPEWLPVRGQTHPVITIPLNQRNP